MPTSGISEMGNPEVRVELPCENPLSEMNPWSANCQSSRRYSENDLIASEPLDFSTQIVYKENGLVFDQRMINGLFNVVKGDRGEDGRSIPGPPGLPGPPGPMSNLQDVSPPSAPEQANTRTNWLIPSSATSCWSTSQTVSSTSQSSEEYQDPW